MTLANIPDELLLHIISNLPLTGLIKGMGTCTVSLHPSHTVTPVLGVCQKWRYIINSSDPDTSVISPSRREFLKLFLDILPYQRQAPNQSIPFDLRVQFYNTLVSQITGQVPPYSAQLDLAEDLRVFILEWPNDHLFRTVWDVLQSQPASARLRRSRGVARQPEDGTPLPDSKQIGWFPVTFPKGDPEAETSPSIVPVLQLRQTLPRPIEAYEYVVLTDVHGMGGTVHDISLSTAHYGVFTGGVVKNERWVAYLRRFWQQDREPFVAKYENDW